jgi:Aromatic-ring hydroxylase, C-terminal
MSVVGPKAEAVPAITGAEIPLTVLDIEPSEARKSYVRNLTLIRPDQHVAWRGDEEPADPLAVIDLLRGAPITRGDLHRIPPAPRKPPPR